MKNFNNEYEINDFNDKVQDTENDTVNNGSK
eukprot:CAMPEP_0116933636 /NCGR_PEP_ID=MMETSP0467-20121206/29165_1 /TAXON_ID=283647 /ORGANISM="Mesodinium pulex, Strain SPMC105" /LENGTH=30 /DNA_ID= /DNA_START= /DNA_END= /DNA_ORIENTATION=